MKKKQRLIAIEMNDANHEQGTIVTLPETVHDKISAIKWLKSNGCNATFILARLVTVVKVSQEETVNTYVNELDVDDALPKM